MSNRISMLSKEHLMGLMGLGWSDRKINRVTGLHRITIARYRKEYQVIKSVNADKTVDEEPAYCKNSSIQKERQSVPLTEKQVPTDGVVHFPARQSGGEVPTGSTTSQTSKSKVWQYHDLIRAKLGLGQSARSIHQDLVTEQDYQGGYDSVKRYVNKLKAREPKLYARLETLPGEEAQVDFGEGAKTLRNGRYRKPWLFVMTLSYGRKSYEEAVWHQDVETFIRCHERAFSHFGGIPGIIKIDNLKSGVLKAHLYEPELNPLYHAFSQHYGFIVLPCRVATPQHKGKVESGVKYAQNNALKGKTFTNLDEQNKHLRYWNRTWASTRIHGTTKRQVNRMFQEEQPYLKSLPETVFPLFKIGQRKVNVIDSHIEVGSAYYPVPPKYMGHEVIVHFNQEWVKVYSQEGLLIQRLSAIPSGQFHPDKRCLPAHKTWSQREYLERLYSQCQRIGATVLEWAQEAVQKRSIPAHRAIAGVINLSRKYSYAMINQACRQSLEKNIFNYHLVFERVKILNAQKQSQEEIPFSQVNEIIRPPSEYQKIVLPDNRRASDGKESAWTN